VEREVSDAIEEGICLFRHSGRGEHSGVVPTFWHLSGDMPQMVAALPKRRGSGLMERNQLIRVFETYGLPERMSMDNGQPWGDTTGRFTALERWLMRQGIQAGHSHPHHPQTQGKLERLHETLKAELSQGRHFRQMREAQQAFDAWRNDYNLERPHEALGQRSPASRCQPSPRRHVPAPAPPQYGTHMQVRKVDANGRLGFRNHVLKIGRIDLKQCAAFVGKPV
jgi:hypothetical protein